MRRASSPVLIGRGQALSRLDAALAAADQGRGGLLVVAGEAGIGKTRLVMDWLTGLPTEVVRAIGGCLDVDEGTLPFLPFVQLLRGLGADTGPTRGAVTGPPATLPDLLALGGSREVDRRGEAELFAAVAARVRSVATKATTVLVIEDGQWLDLGSLQLLRYLASESASTRVLLVVTLRTDAPPASAAVPATLAELARLPGFERIDLPRFDATEIEAQVAAILGRAPRPELVDTVRSWADGNPFFTEEVLALDLADGRSLPPDLRDMLLARVSTAPPDVQTLLGAAAVGGRSVREHDLAVVVELGRTDFRDAARAAVRLHLLVPDGAPEADGLAFRHALVREAVVTDLLPGERRAWHERWATSLASHTPSRSAAIAEHWDRAARPERAVPAYVTAAEAAATALARSDAARSYRRAADLVVTLDPGALGLPDRVDLLERAALEQEFAGDRDDAIETLREALADPALAMDRPRARRLQRRIAEISGQRAHGTLSFQAIHEALADVGEQPDAEGAAVLAAYAMRLGLRGDLAGARASAERAVEAATRVGAVVAEARARQVLGQLAAMDDVDAGVDGLRAAASLAESVGDVDVRMEAITDLSWAYANGGRYLEALAAIEEAWSVADELGARGELRPLYLARRLEYLFLLGRWTEADWMVPDIEASRAWTARFRAAVLRVHQGRAAEAAALVAAALAMRPLDELDVPDRGGVTHTRGSLALAAGDVQAVIDLVDPAVPLPGEEAMEADLLRLGGRAAALASDRAVGGTERQRWTSEARRFAEGLATLSRSPRATRPLVIAHAQDAAADVARLEGADDPGSWVAVAESWAALGIRERAAWATYREAEAILLAGGRRSDAQRRLREVQRVALDLGAHPLLTSIADLARRSRLSLQDETPGDDPDAVAVPGDPHGLSPREREILRLVVDGRTNREIGAALFISPKTVGVHVSNVLGKLGVSNRVEAATLAHRLGITGSDTDPSR